MNYFSNSRINSEINITSSTALCTTANKQICE